MSKKEDLEIILNNQEIEPNNPYDISMRKTPNSVVPRFRGLAGQITVNPDDLYRPYIWLNKGLGEHYEAVLSEDFKTPKYEYKTINVSRSVHEVTVDQNITIDSSVAGVWKVKFTSNVTLTLKLDKLPSEVTVILQSANPFARVTFAGEGGISWIGSAPNIRGDSGTLFAFHFYKTTLGIIGEESRDTPHTTTTTITPVLQAYTSLGYGLPAGTSTVGATGQQYELLSGLAEFSADDLYNIGKVASSINHVEKVVGLEHYFPTIVANATSITTLAAVAKLLADNLGVYKTVSNNVAGILNVNTNLPTITSVKNKLADISAVSGKLTDVSAVSEKLVEISAVNNKLSDISSVNNKLADISSVNNKLTDISAVKGKLAEVTAVKGKLTEIETVKNNLENINTLVPLVTTLQTLANNIEKITKVYDEIIAKEAENTEPTKPTEGA